MHFSWSGGLTLEYHSVTPFDSIENTQEYFGLLSEALIDVQGQIEDDIRREGDASASRRLEALRVVLFKLQKLQENVNSSGRLLNDLRMLRRILLKEKVKNTGTEAKLTSKK